MKHKAVIMGGILVVVLVIGLGVFLANLFETPEATGAPQATGQVRLEPPANATPAPAAVPVLPDDDAPDERPAGGPAGGPAREAATPGAGVAAPDDGWSAEITGFDRVMGDPAAPVTMIEYASFTCGHCADFHLDTLPELKQRYIDQGTLRLVFRDFPLDGLALRAGMLARCAPEDRYFAVVDTLFETQEQWITAEDPMVALGRIARQIGIGEDAFEACMIDDELANRIVQQRLTAQERYQVDATPTFIVGGETLSGNQPIEEFSRLIERLGS